MGKVTLLAIVPKGIKKIAARKELVKVARALGKELTPEYRKVTKTWKGEKPRFTASVDETRNSVKLNVGVPNTESDGNKKFMWLEEGTKVRYATMTPDFQPKTQAGVLGSSKGRGKKAFVDKRKPKPGIKPRGWTEQIIKEKRLPQTMNERVQKALEKAAKESSV